MRDLVYPGTRSHSFDALLEIMQYTLCREDVAEHNYFSVSLFGYFSTTVDVR